MKRLLFLAALLGGAVALAQGFPQQVGAYAPFPLKAVTWGGAVSTSLASSVASDQVLKQSFTGGYVHCKVTTGVGQTATGVLNIQTSVGVNPQDGLQDWTNYPVPSQNVAMAASSSANFDFDVSGIHAPFLRMNYVQSASTGTMICVPQLAGP